MFQADGLKLLMPEWKDTVNLPRTDFPMKASLQTAEPEAIARWEAVDLYGQIREKRRGAPKFVFHDGPPYANGQIHLGTALNKILKDFVICLLYTSDAADERSSVDL